MRSIISLKNTILDIKTPEIPRAYSNDSQGGWRVWSLMGGILQTHNGYRMEQWKQIIDELTEGLPVKEGAGTV